MIQSDCIVYIIIIRCILMTCEEGHVFKCALYAMLQDIVVWGDRLHVFFLLSNDSNGNFRDATWFHDVGFLSVSETLNRISCQDLHSLQGHPIHVQWPLKSGLKPRTLSCDPLDPEVKHGQTEKMIWLPRCLLALAKVWKSSSCCRWPWSLCWPSHPRGRQTVIWCGLQYCRSM